MRNARYYIVNDRDQWLIRFNDEEFGPYLTQAEATLFAVEAAQKLSNRGANAAVYLRGENGRLHREWTCQQVA
jgi:hypothetical protein